MDKNIVFMLFPVFLYWIKLNIIKPIEVIKNQIAGISPSIEPIFYWLKGKTLFPCTFYGAKNSSFDTSLYALPPCLSLCMFSAALQNFLPSGLEPLGFSPIGQLRVAS